MNLQYSVYYGDLAALYSEDDDLPDPDGVLHPVGEEQQVSSVERRLHAATETTQVSHHLEKMTQNGWGKAYRITSSALKHAAHGRPHDYFRYR